MVERVGACHFARSLQDCLMKLGSVCANCEPRSPDDFPARICVNFRGVKLVRGLVGIGLFLVC